MAKSSVKEMLAEPLLHTTHHLLVLLVVAGQLCPRLPWPSLATSHRARTLHLAEDLDLDLDRGLDSTPVLDSLLAVEDGSPNDGQLGL
jgi:hypothetical protein